MAGPESDGRNGGGASSSAKARHLGQALSELLNVTGLLAAPRAHARWSASTDAQQRRRSKAAAVDQLDTMSRFFAAMATGPGAAMLERAPFSPGVDVALEELRTLLDGWDAESPPGPELVAKGREILATLGMPAPPGGWDDYLPDE